MAAMVKYQVVDSYGRIDGPAEVNHFQLTKDPEVLVTQQDVREIQMAKAAIAAGSQMLMKEAGLSLENLDEVGIAGAFGNAIDMEAVMKVTPADILVMGNIDPAGQFASGTVESITSATKELMVKCGSYKNFVPSSGCDIPAHAKWENIHAFFKAVQA